MASERINTLATILPPFLSKGAGSPYRISDPVITSYNAATGEKLVRAGLTEADGEKVAKWLLEKIATQYQDWGFKPNWASVDWIAAVVLGYVAGWSDKGGVGTAILFLQREGLPVTLDNIQKVSKTLNVIPSLRQEKRYKAALGAARAWLDSYMNQFKSQNATKTIKRVEETGLIASIVAGSAGAIFIILALRSKRR